MVSGFCLTLLRFLNSLRFYVIPQSRTNTELRVTESMFYAVCKCLMSEKIFEEPEDALG